MKNVHLMTIGISVLRNFVSSGFDPKLIEKYEMRKWIYLHPDDAEQQNIESYISRENEVFSGILDYLNSCPEDASAELNAFYKFIALTKQKIEDIEIYMYSTDTGVGKLCSRLIYEHLKERNLAVQEPIVIKGLGRGLEFVNEGFIEITDKVVRIIKSKRKTGDRVYVNATGGFKPEVSFLTIAAMLAGADIIYYTYEVFRDVVFLPCLPITVDRKYSEAFKKIGSPIPKYQADETFQLEGLDLTELIDRGLVEEKNGKVVLREWVSKLLDEIEK